MRFWQRLALTLAAMFIASYLSGVLWRQAFDVALPSYIGGLIGGLAALPVWEFLKRAGRRRR